MDSFGEDQLVASCVHGEAAPAAFEQPFNDAVATFVVDGEGPLIDRPADVLKVWPMREPIQRLSPAQFNPLLE